MVELLQYCTLCTLLIPLKPARGNEMVFVKLLTSGGIGLTLMGKVWKVSIKVYNFCWFGLSVVSTYNI